MSQEKLLEVLVLSHFSDSSDELDPLILDDLSIRLHLIGGLLHARGQIVAALSDAVFMEQPLYNEISRTAQILKNLAS